MNPEDICPRPDFLPTQPTQPMSPAIYPAAVYRCESPDQADRLLARTMEGYVYSREGHPNSDQLAEKCRHLHQAEQAAVVSSGMAALSVAVMAHVKAGDRVVASRHLYGKSLVLLQGELARWGAETVVVDTCNLDEVAQALTPNTRLLVAETISNPVLRVADIAQLSALAHGVGAQLLIDNSFAGPTVCRPLELGADLVMESLTKIMNGHSDVLLGLLCGRTSAWSRVAQAVTTWGFACSPFDCWLAARGLGTLALRADKAGQNAQRVAEFLAERDDVTEVHYPGLPGHPDHQLAARQFQGGCGSMVTFTLPHGRAAATRFIEAAMQIPFSPSLGDLSTTLSHPESTSHRGMTPEQRAALGISGGTIRLSVGVESAEAIRQALKTGLDACRATDRIK